MNHLCVFDMDDTLLSPDKTISEENLKALEHLKELDIGISIATGRSHYLIGKYINQLGITLPVISCNGGMLVQYWGNEIIWENPIRKDLLARILLYLLDQEADFVAYTAERIYYPAGSTGVSLFLNYNKTVTPDHQAPLREFLRGDLEKELPDICKILVFGPTAEQDVYIRAVEGLEVLCSADKVLDIMQEGSTKGNAVLSLAKHLGIPIENVAVFGDNENDLSMFACGAVSVAMGNSRDRIKESASYVTGTNRESGVAQAIEAYVLPLFGKK